jgi:predicted phage replisome organizer
MADINWIKLRIDMFDDEKIKIIQSMPEGDAILVIWIRLIALAGKCNSNGFVLVEDEFPYSDEMLSVIFNKPLTTVRLALQTFEKFKMVESTTRGIYITNFEKHQNVEGMDKIREQNRIRKQRERERKRALLDEKKIPELPCSSEIDCSFDDTCHVTVTETSREVTQQRENKNKNKNIYNISSNEDIVETPESPEGSLRHKNENVRLSYDAIVEDYHSTCRDLPGVRAMSDARKKKIRTLLNEFERMKVFPELSP